MPSFQHGRTAISSVSLMSCLITVTLSIPHSVSCRSVWLSSFHYNLPPVHKTCCTCYCREEQVATAFSHVRSDGKPIRQCRGLRATLFPRKLLMRGKFLKWILISYYVSPPYKLQLVRQLKSGHGSSVGIATELRAGRSGIESRWGRDFSPIQTGPGAHPASCKMGTGSFPGVKCRRGVLLTTHPLLVQRSWKSRAVTLPTLWATPGL